MCTEWCSTLLFTAQQIYCVLSQNALLLAKHDDTCTP
jgi:hypothetical protein